MAATEVAETAVRRASPWGDVAVGAVLVVLAVAARLGTVYARGSLADGTGYDPSVYYASADALVHGLLPYRDYTLLHPPGMTLLLSPVALIGRATTDNTGYILATLMSVLVGAANSLLIFRILRRMHLTLLAAGAAGLLYAVTQLSVRSETTAHMEGWGNLLVLLGIWCYVSSLRVGGARMSVLTGAALAAAASVKIWYVVPLLVVLLWHLNGRRGWRPFLLVLGGAVGAAVAINGPFLILAGRELIRMVVVDQVGRRGDSALGRLARVSDLDLANAVVPHAAHAAQALIAVVAVSVAGAIVALAWSIPAGRLPGMLVVAQLLVLFAAPVYLWFYADYVMPALCLCAGAAVHAVQGRAGSGGRSEAVLAAGLVAVSTVLLIRIDTTHPSESAVARPGPAMMRATAGVRCVQSTSPMPLILLNVLSRDIDNGCPQWVDVSGRTYSADRGAESPRRIQNQNWQRDVLRYLLAGQQYVLVDVQREGLNRHTLSLLRRGPVIARSPDFVLRRRIPGRTG